MPTEAEKEATHGPNSTRSHLPTQLPSCLPPPVSNIWLIPRRDQMTTWWQIDHTGSLPGWKGLHFIFSGGDSGNGLAFLPTRPPPGARRVPERLAHWLSPLTQSHQARKPAFQQGGGEQARGHRDLWPHPSLTARKPQADGAEESPVGDASPGDGVLCLHYMRDPGVAGFRACARAATGPGCQGVAVQGHGAQASGHLLVPAGPAWAGRIPLSRHMLPELGAGESLKAVAMQTPGHFQARQETRGLISVLCGLSHPSVTPRSCALIGINWL